jgi:hypothetical protein
VYIPLSLLASLGLGFFVSSTATRRLVGPGSARRVEATLHPWNKLLQLLLRLAGACSGASEELQRCELVIMFSSCPSLISVSICTSDAGFSGSLGRYVYQRAEKSGWLLFPTCSGGLVPIWVVPSSGELGLLAILEAPDSLSPGYKVLDG